MFPKHSLRKSSLSILIFVLSISLTVFLMGCITSSRAVGIHAPSHVKANNYDPCSIQWNDNARDEDGYIIYIVGYTERFEHGRVGPNVEHYSFDMKSCEIAEYYFGEGEIGINQGEARQTLFVAVEVYKEGESPPEDETWTSGPIKIWDRLDTPENGGDSPLEAPRISETVGDNPCSIGWEHSGAGFYPCSVEGEEGFRIYVGIFPETQTPSINDNGWIWLATVDKNARGYSFGIFCDQILEVGYGEKAWAFVEAFTTRNLLGDRDAVSDIVLLHHSERPTQSQVEPAIFDEAILPQSRIGEQVVGTDYYSPENISFDGEYETENIYQSYTSEIIIRGDHPYLEVTGRTNNSHGQSRASINYFFQVVPITSSAPMDIEVPLVVEVQGHASTAIWPSYSKAQASITLEVYGIEYYSTTFGACLDESVPSQCSYPSSVEWNEQYQITLDFVHNNIGSFSVIASLDIYESGSGEIVIEEPRIYIDPSFEVEGTPATELYRILYSEGIIPFDES